MGVHTGDSVTVAPAQTLTDPLYQELRDQAIEVIRAVGVETGGSNVQFAVNPDDGEIVVIEMNPRVSRSSALASKATGFPIAKMAAKLAVGYALEEIPNDITRATPASFEPTIDYVVTKIPRFAFEKFPGAEGRLSTYMQSVGEVMSIGRTFRESFAKALRSRELDSAARASRLRRGAAGATRRRPARSASTWCWRPSAAGIGVEAVHERCLVDRWFLRELEALATEGDGTEGLDRTYKSVDTCAAEFEAATPYYYSAHERPRARRRARLRGPPRRARLGGHPRRRPEPDRPGDRVRLLLRPRRDDRARAGPRRGDGQLQPGDGLDRLRHLRPPLLRAADRRGRARGLRAGAPRGRDRPVRRPDPAEAGPGPRGGGRAAARHPGRRDRPGRGPRPLRRPAAPPRHQAPALRHRALGRGGGGDRRGGRLPAAGPALLRARRPGDGDLLLDRGPQRLPRGPRQGRPGAPAAARPLPRERDRGRRRRARPTARTSTSPGSCSTSRRPASTPATRPA